MMINFCTTILLVTCGLCLSMVNATVAPNSRNNLESVPPVWQSGYSVPLRGSLTCKFEGSCDFTLPSPPSDKVLRYLTIARGINTYNCTDRDVFRNPILESQTTTLWDAAPILPHIKSEADFHALIPQLLEFDYAALTNTSLTCIGGLASHQSEQIIDIFDITSFAAQVQEVVNAPVESSQNLQWAHMTSLDNSWDIYRVETAGGKSSPGCGQQNKIVTSDYAAEYWFYH